MHRIGVRARADGRARDDVAPPGFVALCVCGAGGLKLLERYVRSEVAVVSCKLSFDSGVVLMIIDDSLLV